MIPLLVFVGAIRLARPNSIWARWRYEARPKRMARADRREQRWHGRIQRFRVRTMDLIAGAPTNTDDADTPHDSLDDAHGPRDPHGRPSLDAADAPAVPARQRDETSS
jgi:lysyl-tRNA synthetase class 2